MSESENISLLETIVKDQREIIATVFGKPANEVPQVWALYKEVQGYYDKGMRVPDDVSLVGFDDQPGSSYTIPPLTTVRQPMTEMGTAAAQAVLHLIEDQEPDLPVLNTELIIRESVATIVRTDYNYKIYTPI